MAGIKIDLTKIVKKLNFSKFFQKEAKNLASQYKRLLSNKQGVMIGTAGRIDSAPHNRPFTIMKKGFDHWLVATGETRDKGILFKSGKWFMTVFASDKQHSGKYMDKRKIREPGPDSPSPPTYKELFERHNTADGRYSGIFGGMPKGTAFFQRFQKEFERQLIPQIKKELKKTIKINIR